MWFSLAPWNNSNSRSNSSLRFKINKNNHVFASCVVLVVSWSKYYSNGHLYCSLTRSSRCFAAKFRKCFCSCDKIAYRHVRIRPC